MIEYQGYKFNNFTIENWIWMSDGLCWSLRYYNFLRCLDDRFNPIYSSTPTTPYGMHEEVAKVIHMWQMTACMCACVMKPTNVYNKNVCHKGLMELSLSPESFCNLSLFLTEFWSSPILSHEYISSSFFWSSPLLSHIICISLSLSITFNLFFLVIRGYVESYEHSFHVMSEVSKVCINQVELARSI